MNNILNLHPEVEYYRLKVEWCGKIKGTIFEVPGNSSVISWYDKESGTNISLDLTSKILEKLPDLQIQSFLYKNSVLYKRIGKTNNYKSASGDMQERLQMIESDDYQIQSALNNNGIEFHIGEKVNFGTIKKIVLDKEIGAYVFFKNGISYPLNKIEKNYLATGAVTFDFEKISFENKLSSDEFFSFVKANYENLPITLDSEQNINNFISSLPYPFLKGVFEKFFSNYNMSIFTDRKKSCFYYRIDVDGKVIENDGLANMGEPNFSNQDQAHISAVYSLFNHLNQKLFFDINNKHIIKE